MLTPELAAPVLVLHQPAVDLIASTLSSAGGRGSRRWHGVLGPAVDALEGCATSDPRAASVLSGVALEVTGVSGDGSARDASINGGNFPSARSSGKWLGSCQAGGVVMDGELMIEDSHDGNTGGGRGGLALTANEAYYRRVRLQLATVLPGRWCACFSGSLSAFGAFLRCSLHLKSCRESLSLSRKLLLALLKRF